MAEFDGEMLLQDQNAQLAHENIQLRNSFETQTQEITYLRNMVLQPPRSPPPPSKSLNPPLPPRFSGSSSDLNSFKLRLVQYLGSNIDAYADSHNQSQYMEGVAHPVRVFLDHKNLEYFSQARTTSRRHARWAAALVAFDYTIIYRKGSCNGLPDALC